MCGLGGVEVARSNSEDPVPKCDVRNSVPRLSRRAVSRMLICSANDDDTEVVMPSPVPTPS